LGPPRFKVPLAPQFWGSQPDWVRWNWDAVPTLTPFILADGSGLATQQTVARICYDAQALYARFDCDDDDIWGSYTQRDQPLYDEEVVELFIAPGENDPPDYFEFEISPNGVLFDARVRNPTSRRRDMVVDVAWDCEGIRWYAERRDDAECWWAMLAIPWQAVKPPGRLPTVWRANLYRIDRPRHGRPEFSAWSPTATEPVDFHKPACFGALVLA
jgi:hypothetical protein